MRETWRVLRPGGTFLGSVAFLEPFHMNSFYHHTHLGLINTLTVAGFQNISVMPSRAWTGLVAFIQMGLFPGAPKWAQRCLTWPIQKLHQQWWRGMYRRNQWYTEQNRDRTNTGAFSFYATKA